MKSYLKCLLDHVPVGTAEAEHELLLKAYVKTESFSDYITPPPNSPRLLIGKKGTGKTAIIKYTSSVLAAAKVPYLALKPMDLEIGPSNTDSAVGNLTREAYATILSSIAAELGSQQTGLIDENDRTLYEEAIKSGKSKRDLVSSAARLLPRIAKNIIKIDLTNLFPLTTATAVELRAAIEENVKTTAGGFYLFLDDIDQVAAPSMSDQLNRIWAYLLAARELTQRIPQIKVIITIREEVWRRLIRDSAGQRDQADHFMPLIRELSPNRDHIKAVVQRRLELALKACIKEEDYKFNFYAPFFVGDSVCMPNTKEERSWEDIIVLRARERPRDAIQLINAMCTHAINLTHPKITEKDFHEVMPLFSEQRVFFLAQEVDSECPQIRELVESFARLEFDYGAFKLTADKLRKHLHTVPTIFSLSLFGRIIQPNNDDDALLVWRFLFEIGVINARVADKREKDGYRHLLPKDAPGLITKSKWSEMQGMIWEINPAYRDFLISKKEDAAQRIGLPPRRK